jgi:hypothetical protein
MAASLPSASAHPHPPCRSDVDSLACDKSVSTQFVIDNPTATSTHKTGAPNGQQPPHHERAATHRSRPSTGNTRRGTPGRGQRSPALCASSAERAAGGLADRPDQTHAYRPEFGVGCRAAPDAAEAGVVQGLAPRRSPCRAEPNRRRPAPRGKMPRAHAGATRGRAGSPWRGGVGGPHSWTRHPRPSDGRSRFGTADVLRRGRSCTPTRHTGFSS